MRRPYSLKILWHGRNRFLPAILAVSFSAVLIAVQFGVLLGTLAVTSRPIDHAAAQMWIGIRGTPSIELGHPIPTSWMFRIQSQPEVEEVERYLYEFTYWHKPTGGAVHCCIIGARLEGSSLGAVNDLTPELRTRLTEPGAVVVDETELDRLGLTHGIGETAEVIGHKVRVVGLVRGFKSIWGPYVFCSMQTARMILYQYQPDEVQYLLATCRRSEDVPVVIERLRRKYPEMSAIAYRDFSIRTRLYWLTRTRVGLALGLTSVLALIVGLVITSQTLYAATAASLREYAVLRALGSAALAHLGAGAGAVVLDRSGGRGHVVARGPDCGTSGRRHWSRGAVTTVAAARYDNSDDGHCPVLRFAGPSLATTGGTGQLVALRDFMAESNVTITAHNLTRSFGSGEEQTIAVHEASLELRAGEMSLLMGPSGSGKTTLLAMLSGLLRPDSGQVMAAGRDLWRMSDEEREHFRLHHCGFIFQGSNLMPALERAITWRWSCAGRGDAVGRGSHQGHGHAGPTRPVSEGEPVAGASVRRRKTARGDRPSAHQAAGPVLRRRTDQRSGLGARQAHRRTTARDGPPRRDRRDGHARLSYSPLCRSHLSYRGWLAARSRNAIDNSG